VRQAHPPHRYRRRQAVGPIVTLLAVVTLFLFVTSPGLGREPTMGPTPEADTAIAAASEPPTRTSSPRGTSSGGTDSVARIAGLAANTTALRPAVLGIGPEPADPHRRAAPAKLEAVAVARLGRGLTAVVLGDSYTSGWNGAGIGSRGWPAVVGANRSWKIVNLSVPGTGFMNPGWTNQTIGSRVDATVRQKPQVVLVAGGHNDSRWSAAATSRAAVRTIARLHAALPNAAIVVIGPIWQNGSPPARCLILRDALRREAASIGALFIDPLAEHWFAGASHRYVGRDGLHPTNAGHAWLASRILADLAGI
jgi:lysophospholipase L1-like esterase